jgi:hypothetical protein
MLKYAMGIINANSESQEELICDDAKVLVRKSLKETKDDAMKGLVEDATSFCSSFYSQEAVS